jgi:glycosyltransferase involved in cell wall biosynthesis
VDKLLRNDETGISVELDDCEGMANAWERLLDDEELRRAMGTSARTHIVENYSAQRMAREYEELYLELASRAN